MDQTVAAYAKFMAGLEIFYGKRTPFVISEFGNYGSGSGPFDDDKRMFDGALSTVAYVVGMINQGAAGLVRWEFIIGGDKYRNFGALTALDPGYFFRPYGPV